MRKQTVTVDRVDESGAGFYEPEDGDRKVWLGTLPASMEGEELEVERWSPDQATIKDGRYQISPHEEYSSPDTSSEAILGTSGLDLESGDYVCGLATDPGILRVGGFKIDAPGAVPDELSIVRIEDAKENRYGANEASGRRVDERSVFAPSVEGGLGLKTLKATGMWSPPTLGDVELRILQSVADSVRERGSVSLLNPGYNPHFAVFVTAELLYQANGESDVVLYTPGSQVHWGTKKDIRDVYEHIGLSTDSGETADALSLKKVFPHAYVYDGDVRSKMDGLFERRLIVTKDLEELPNDLDIAAIIADWTSRKKSNDRESLKELEATYSDTSFVTISSPYTKNERDGVPDYGPVAPMEGFDVVPRKAELTSALEGYEPQVGRSRVGVTDCDSGPGQQIGGPLPTSTTDLQGMLRQNTTTISPVDSGTIGKWLDGVLEQFEDLQEHDHPGIASRIYSAEMYFERLSVPPEQHDEWIREQYENDVRYLPDPIDVVIENLEELGGRTDAVMAPPSIFGAVKRLRKVQEILEDRNPMFRRILEEVRGAVETDTRISIFCPRKSLSGMLRKSLLSEGVDPDSIGTNVILADPDSIRDMPASQKLIFPGPQRPQYAGFFRHPRAKTIEILTYDGGWSKTMQKYVKRYTDHLNEAVRGGEATLYPSTDISIQDEGCGGREGSEGGLRIQHDRPQDGESSDEGEAIPEDESNPEVGSDDDPDVSLDATARDRLLDIVGAAPTSNGELQTQWGLESGSDVHRYLSSTLGDYYTRDEDKYIVPTEQGLKMAEEIQGTERIGEST